MIKIAFIRNVSPYNRGGIKKHCVELSSLFSKEDEITILPIVDIPTKRIPVLNKTIFVNSALFNYLKNIDCDIVHIHGFATLDVIQSFLIARYLKKKIVFSPHYHPFKYLQHPFLGRLFFYGCLRFLLRFSSAIITITQNDTVFFQKYHKVVCKIPHAFQSLNKNTKFERKKANMILFVGRNDDNKGISNLYNIDPRYEVHVVSRGEIKRKDFIVHNNISNEELSLLYAKSSLVVIPSRYEAFSYVALEAFAHGTPVVMSKTVMIADYLHGLRGYATFDFGDEKAFLLAVEKTIGISVDKELILRKFDRIIIKSSYLEVYRDVFEKYNC